MMSFGDALCLRLQASHTTYRRGEIFQLKRPWRREGSQTQQGFSMGHMNEGCGVVEMCRK